MDDRIMTFIRTAINEATETAFDDDEVEETWLVLNRNTKMTIAHFLFAKAQSVTFATMPTVPTLDMTPVDGKVVWQQKSQNQINTFDRELNLAKEEDTDARLQIEVLREQGKIWMQAALDGGPM